MNNKSSYLEENSFFEGLDLSTLSNEDLYLNFMFFQQEKNRCFRKYIFFLDKQLEEANLINSPIKEYEEAKNKSWERHLYFEDLIQKCFKETEKRIKKM